MDGTLYSMSHGLIVSQEKWIIVLLSYLIFFHHIVNLTASIDYIGYISSLVKACLRSLLIKCKLLIYYRSFSVSNTYQDLLLIQHRVIMFLKSKQPLLFHLFISTFIDMFDLGFRGECHMLFLASWSHLSKTNFSWSFI